MSEETTPAKKAARKSVRKKSASKRAPRKSASSESSTSEEQLSLDGAQPTEAAAPSHEEASKPETKKETSNTRKSREPKSGVRDARREPSEESNSTEVSEKLVPEEEGSGEDRRERSQDSQREQGRNDQSENRGRGRSRGRGRGQDRGQDRERERPEKREPKPRVQVDGKDMAKKAWKIFESEVTEEGLALLDDNGLRDYARSSFNAARLFLEEKGRVVGRKEKSKKDGKKDKDDD